MKYEQHYPEKDGWSKWITPIRRGYKMACCDCGLVHTVDFRVRGGRSQMRLRRNNRSTAMIRRWDKTLKRGDKQ